MSEEFPDGMAAEEQFENGYHYFIEAVEILSMPAAAQCDVMGNYNVAWELCDDVKAGKYLIDLPYAYLSSEHHAEIVALIAALDSIPEAVLGAGVGVEESRASMEHQCWTPLREQAAKLLVSLRSRTQQNVDYFQSQGLPERGVGKSN